MSDVWKIIAAISVVILASFVFKKQRKKIVAMGAYQFFCWTIDNPLWWYVELVWRQNGVVIMILVAFFLNCGLLLYYRNKKVFWLSWDVVDGIGNKWYIKRKFGDVAMFFFLSIFQDPFITATFLRHGRENGLSKRDYEIFIASNIVGIGYWVIRNGLLTEVILRPMLNF